MRIWMAAWTVGTMLAAASGGVGRGGPGKPGGAHRHHPCDRQREPVVHGARRCPGPRDCRLPRRRPSTSSGRRRRGSLRRAKVRTHCRSMSASSSFPPTWPRRNAARKNWTTASWASRSAERARLVDGLHTSSTTASSASQWHISAGRARARPRHGPRGWPRADGRQQSFRRGLDAGELESAREPAADVHERTRCSRSVAGSWPRSGG